MTADPAVQRRLNEWVADTRVTLDASRQVANSGVEEARIDLATLTKAVAVGVLDAPQLPNSRYALGQVQTQILRDSACVTVDTYGSDVSESNRIAHLFQDIEK